MRHDVFICHASEDKKDFVRPLAKALQSHDIDVWYDEFSMTVGDSLRQTIDKGLSSSRFGIVVLSSHFFKKGWANHELNGLVSRHVAERNVILPVWHNVNHEDILAYSPPLADMIAVSSSDGMEAVVRTLVNKIRPQESPLKVASEFLAEKGLNPPPISDEWWLDIVETKESALLYPNLNYNWRWIFPLPYASGSRGRKRGINIGWTALQLDWHVDGESRKICQLTHPEIVQDYLRQWPGLYECARLNPHILALYAPQLTIPGFDTGFEDVFDNLLRPDNYERCEAFRYGEAETTDGQKALCGDFISWRHPTFGNHTLGSLSYEFVTAHNEHYSRRQFDGFDCLIWLLSSDAYWMPDRLRDTLLQGFKESVSWWLGDQGCVYIMEYLFDSTAKKFKYTKPLRNDLLNQCRYALTNLNVEDNPEAICSRFIEYGFLEGYYEEKERIKQRRKDIERELKTN